MPISSPPRERENQSNNARQEKRPMPASPLREKRHQRRRQDCSDGGARAQQTPRERATLRGKPGHHHALNRRKRARFRGPEQRAGSGELPQIARETAAE